MGNLDLRIIPLASTLEPSRAAAPAVVQIAPLGEDLCAVFHVLPANWKRFGKRLEYGAGSQALTGPVVGTQVDLADRTVRNVVFLRQSAAAVLARGLSVRMGERLVAQLDPDALQSPITDPGAVCLGVSRNGATRLLRLMVTAGAGFLGAGKIAGFDRLLPQLLRAAQARELPCVSQRPLGQTRCLGTWRLASERDRPRLSELILLQNGHARRIEPPLEIAPSHPLRLDLVLGMRLQSGARLVAFTPHPVILQGLRPGSRPAHVFGWYRRCAPEARVQIEGILEAAAPADPLAKTQLAEIRSADCHQPRAQMHLAVATRRGVLFAARIEDPLDLVKAVRLSDGDMRHVVNTAAPLLHPDLGQVQLGYVRWPAAARDSARRLDVDLVTHSGRLLRQDPWTVAQTGLPVSELARMEGHLSRRDMLSDAFEDMLADRPPIPLRDLSRDPAPAGGQGVICVSPASDRDYLRAVLTSLALDMRAPEFRVAVILYSDAELRAVDPVMSEARAICRFPVDALAASDCALPSEILRAAADRFGGGHLLWLDPGVLPQLPGWASRMQRKLSRARTARIVRAPVAAMDPCAIPSEADGRFGTLFGLNRPAIEALQAMPLLSTTTRGAVGALVATLPTRSTVWDDSELAVGLCETDPRDLALLDAVEHALAGRWSDRSRRRGP